MEYPVIFETKGLSYVSSFPGLHLVTLSGKVSTEELVIRTRAKIADLIKKRQTEEFPKPTDFPEHYPKDKLVVWIHVDEKLPTVRKNLTILSYLADAADEASINLSQFLTKELKKRLF